MKNKKTIIIFFIILSIFSTSIACYSFFGKSSRTYKSFEQFTGQKVGINVTLIDDEWNSGVDAIGVVEKYIRPGVVFLEYYYRDTNTFTWNYFYRVRVNMP